MTVVRGRTNKFGPGTVDIQLVQGADFRLALTLSHGTTPWDLTNAIFTARMSTEWGPGGRCFEFTVTVIDASLGHLVVSATKEDLDDLISPMNIPPRKTTDPRTHNLGGWTLLIEDAGVTQCLLNGNVQWERGPCRM